MNYTPHTEEDRQEMLAAIGADSAEKLFSDIPEEISFKGKLNLPQALSELEIARLLKELSDKNVNLDEYSCFLGAGSYDHYIPAIVDQMLLRSEFYTAYTPYQPEISQGTLQAIFEYQSMITELTSMDVANASMYDGASALAEAALMACEASRRNKVLISRGVHPEYRQVVQTYAAARGFKVEEISMEDGLTSLVELEKKLDDAVAGVLLQNPNFLGIIETDVAEISRMTHAKKAKLVACVNPVSLSVLKPPGQYEADIVVGEGQSLGNNTSYGGPYLGFFAATSKLMRKMPGRIVGKTVDSRGQQGFVLTLQAREQHIRREKATSNICSNEALCALAATIYLASIGKKGLRQVALNSLQKAHYAYDKLTALNGVEAAFNAPFFHEFAVKTSAEPDDINNKLLDHKIIGGLNLGKFYPEYQKQMLFCVTEKRTREEIDNLSLKLGGALA